MSALFVILLAHGPVTSPPLPPFQAAETLLKGHCGLVREVAFGCDGTTLASWGDDGTVRLWDVVTGKERAVIRLEGGEAMDVASSVAFSPDGKTLALGSYDASIELWETATGRRRHRLKGHKRFVLALAFAPDGRALMSGSLDGTVIVWDLKEGAAKGTIRRKAEYPGSLDISPDGRLLVAEQTDKTIGLWDVRSLKLKAELNDPERMDCVAFHPRGKTLAYSTYAGTIKLWDIKTGKATRTFGKHDKWIAGLTFSADGKVLASTSSVCSILLWDVQTGQVRARLGAPTFLNRAALSPQGTFVAVAGKDGHIRLWRIPTAGPSAGAKK